MHSSPEEKIMKTTHSTMLTIISFIVLSLVPFSLFADTLPKTTIPEIGEHGEQLVEGTAIPLDSTFKEDEGYGVWNLLIGEGESKLLCYEDGANIDDLRGAHEDIELIIEKNEDFKQEGVDLQTIRVRGVYDGENEILNLTEIVFTKANTEYQVVTDPADEPEGMGEEQEFYEYERPIEKYIIYHEVGRPWLNAPAWYHYPAWWGFVWVDVHWWWRPWYDCDLGWYRDRYCNHWRSGYYDSYGYCYDGGKPYRYDGRRRGIGRDRDVRYHDKQYRAKRNDSRKSYPSKEYRAPGRDVKTDRYRGVKPKQKNFRKTDRSLTPSRKSYRTGSKSGQPTIRSRPSTRSRPSRSTIRSTPSPSRGGRSPASRPSSTRSGRRR